MNFLEIKFRPIIVVLLVLSITIVFFCYTNKSRLNESIESDRSSFTLITNITADSISYGYFQWDELYYALLQDNKDKYLGFLEEIYDMSPYIKDLRIIGEKPFDEFQYYSLEGKNNCLYLNFKVYDGMTENFIKDKYIQVTLDSELLLFDIQKNQDIVITDSVEGRIFLYNLRVETTRSPIFFSQIVIGIILGILCAFAVEVIWTHYFSFFYDTRGLEKIIFLFEKAESYSANHSKQVAKIATYIGKKAGLKEKKLKDLTVAAFLHDIGKISVPVTILNKKEKLSEDEFAEIKKHVLYSAEILQNFEELSHLKDIVLYHHEKIDGSGYPFGKKGDEIPLESRIIAVADIFEALIGKRPYREPLDPDSAVALMKDISLDSYFFKILEDNLNDVVQLTSYKDNRSRMESAYIQTLPS